MQYMLTILVAQARAPEGWEFHDVEEEYQVDAQGRGAWVPVPPPQAEGPADPEALLVGKKVSLWRLLDSSLIKMEAKGQRCHHRAFRLVFCHA